MTERDEKRCDALYRHRRPCRAVATEEVRVAAGPVRLCYQHARALGESVIRTRWGWTLDRDDVEGER